MASSQQPGQRPSDGSARAKQSEQAIKRTPGKTSQNRTSRPGQSSRQAQSPSQRSAQRRDERSQQRSANARAATKTEQRNTDQASPASRKLLPKGVRLTRRAMALIAVAAVLAFGYVQTLRVYLTLQSEISAAKLEIQQREDAIRSLQEELKAWQDPDYVKMQARDRLGWVVPGEVGYRVIGPDGKPYGGGVQIDQAGRLPANEHAKTWWERLWGSTRAADDPAPATPAPERTIPAPTSSESPR